MEGLFRVSNYTVPIRVTLQDEDLFISKENLSERNNKSNCSGSTVPSLSYSETRVPCRTVSGLPLKNVPCFYYTVLDVNYFGFSVTCTPPSRLWLCKSTVGFVHGGREQQAELRRSKLRRTLNFSLESIYSSPLGIRMYLICRGKPLLSVQSRLLFLLFLLKSTYGLSRFYSLSGKSTYSLNSFLIPNNFTVYTPINRVLSLSLFID